MKETTVNDNALSVKIAFAIVYIEAITCFLIIFFHGFAVYGYEYEILSYSLWYVVLNILEFFTDSTLQQITFVLEIIALGYIFIYYYSKLKSSESMLYICKKIFSDLWQEGVHAIKWCRGKNIILGAISINFIFVTINYINFYIFNNLLNMNDLAHAFGKIIRIIIAPIFFIDIMALISIFVLNIIPKSLYKQELGNAIMKEEKRSSYMIHKKGMFDSPLFCLFTMIFVGAVILYGEYSYVYDNLSARHHIDDGTWLLLLIGFLIGTGLILLAIVSIVILAIRIFALGVGMTASAIATVAGASDETARAVGNVVSGITGAVVAGEIAAELGSAANSNTIDTSTVVASGVAVGDIASINVDTSSFASSGVDMSGNIDIGATDMSLDSSSFGNIGVDSVSAANTAIDAPNIQSYDVQPSNMVGNDDNSMAGFDGTNRISILDSNGMSQGSITNMSDGTTIVQNNFSFTDGIINGDGTGNITLNMNGQESVTITDSGAILNSMGLSDGRIESMPNGDAVILNNMNQTQYIIKADGVILDNSNTTIGRLKQV